MNMPPRCACRCMPAGIGQHHHACLPFFGRRNNNNNNNNNIMVSLKGVKVSILLCSIAAAAATPGNGDEPVDSPYFSKREQLRSDADDAMSKSSLPDVIIGASSESKRSLLSYGPYGPPGSKSMSYTTTTTKSSKTKASKTKASKAAAKAAKAKATKVTKSSKASYSYSMSYGCERSPCVDSDVPRFIIDASKDIGDTLDDSGFTKRCGCDCYTVKDSGDDPPFDPQLGDTQRFAYRKVTSKNFSIKSRVCGVKCYGDDGQPVSQLIYGRVGLEVRESFDPLAAHVFISHKPQLLADSSWRKEYNGTYFWGPDYSPDVQCLWITLKRDGNTFTSTYAYDPSTPDEVCESDYDIYLDQEVVIDMSDTVYVGLAVSSEVYTGEHGSSCKYTEADFESIEFVCDGEGC